MTEAFLTTHLQDMSMQTNVINRLAQLDEGSVLANTRAQRPEFIDGAEACRAAVLEPEVDAGLGRPLRAALAARMARLNGDEILANHYRDMLTALGSDPAMSTIADGAYPDAVDARLRAIIRHTDFITIAPRACTRADTERLVAQGLTIPEIVALAELIGFLNFEVRILATLNLLKVTP